MKILTKEEEQENYNETLKGGAVGGIGGLGLGALGVWAASVRYPAFRGLTLPLRAFLITSTGTFGAIVAADSFSRAHERQRNPDNQYKDDTQQAQEQAEAQKPLQTKAYDWLSANRYNIVFGSWVASMGVALGIVGRNPYQTAQQKLVQARMWAQGLTIGIVVLSLAFEGADSAQGRGRWETIKVVDPNDPEHKHMIEKQIHHESYEGEDQWRDMVEAEEERLKEREEQRKKKDNKGKGSKQSNEKATKTSEGADEKPATVKAP